MSKLASEESPLAEHMMLEERAYIFSDCSSFSSSLVVTETLDASTRPSLVRMPTDGALLLMDSMAYSTCMSLPSGVNVVVLESYLLDIWNI